MTCLSTEGPGHASELAHGLHDESRRLVVVGGDGTLREAAEGLGPRAGTVELGFVPMGNANVVARELGIPLDPVRSVDVATAGEARVFDALRANGRFVLAMVGVGYDGVVTRRVTRARAGGLTGAWYRLHADSLYGVIGLLSLFASCPRFRLEVDGREVPTPFRNMVVANIETYAKGWAMAPGADPGDGFLDYQVRRYGSPPFGLWSLWGASRRRRVPSFVARYGRGERFRLSGERPFPWQADGDPMGRTGELEVEVLPAALRVIGPPGLPA